MILGLFATIFKSRTLSRAKMRHCDPHQILEADEDFIQTETAIMTLISHIIDPYQISECKLGLYNLGTSNIVFLLRVLEGHQNIEGSEIADELSACRKSKQFKECMWFRAVVYTITCFYFFETKT